MITVDCWSHQVRFQNYNGSQQTRANPMFTIHGQINLIVGDYLKACPHVVTLLDRALEVIKWLNNHSRTLGLLRHEQVTRYTKALILILPVLTRWTSHYLSISRLLDIEGAIRVLVAGSRDVLVLVAGKQAEMIRKAEEVLNYVATPSFWNDLRR